MWFLQRVAYKYMDVARKDVALKTAYVVLSALMLPSQKCQWAPIRPQTITRTWLLNSLLMVLYVFDPKHTASISYKKDLEYWNICFHCVMDHPRFLPRAVDADKVSSVRLCHSSYHGCCFYASRIFWPQLFFLKKETNLYPKIASKQNLFLARVANLMCKNWCTITGIN